MTVVLLFVAAFIVMTSPGNLGYAQERRCLLSFLNPMNLTQLLVKCLVCPESSADTNNRRGHNITSVY